MDNIFSRSEQLKYLPILKGVDAEKNLLNKAQANDKMNLKGMLH